MEEIYKDRRFAHIPSDPAYKRIPKRERKVKIDKRFQSMFSDKKFKVKYTVDKRGRPLTNSSTENLKRYYDLDSSGEGEQSNDDLGLGNKIIDNATVEANRTKEKKCETSNIFPVEDVRKSKKGVSFVDADDNCSKKDVEASSTSDDDDDDDDDDEVLEDQEREVHGNDKLERGFRIMDEKIRARLQDLKVDYARGEGAILSDSSSDEESTDDEEPDDDFSHGWGELDQDAERTDDSTCRLAVCNIDWDRVKACDLMVLLNSFLPKGGVMLSVTVYPSEFGLKRMKEEEEKGPLELRGNEDTVLRGSDLDDDEEEEDKKKKKKKEEADDELEEGDEYHREKLRQYQLNRLKYYYAVVVCDSISTADALYKECDGMEYESSAARLDLRFIPDNTTFDQEPRDKCSELPEMTKYEPQLFVTTALQQSKVRLTWDETDPRRKKLNERINSGKVDEVDESDLKGYLATSSSEEESNKEEDKEDAASKYRSLLQSIESAEEEKKPGMEMEVTWGIDLKDKVEKRMKDGKPDELTPFQKYVQKRKDKRRVKREEQMKKKQEYREADGQVQVDSVSEDDIPSDVDMNDAYFKEEFQKGEFAQIKKNSSKKKKNKKKHDEAESEDEETKRKKAELELLLMDQEDEKKHFSLKDILVDDSKSKKKKKKMKLAEENNTTKNDEFEVNVKDNRFSALFTSHLYNIDPADPHYKKTKGMEALRQEKLSRREINDEVPVKKQKVDSYKKDAELSLLVKNVKRKAQTMNK